MYYGMPKGTSRTEATSNSEKIKPVALAIIKLRLSLQHRRRRGDLIYLYQILKGSYDIENHLFTPSTSTVTRGHTRKLFKHHTNSYTRSNFYSNRVINDWNSLPQSIVDSPSVNDFKTLLDRHYSNCLFDFV